MQIPKAQKKTDNLTVFFALLGSAHVKAGRRSLMKLTPRRHHVTLCPKCRHYFETIVFYYKTLIFMRKNTIDICVQK